MTGELKFEVVVPINDNTTFPVKILTEEKAKEMVLKALEDITGEIEEKAHHFLALHNTQRVEGLEDALNIIDKYKIESEDKE